MDQVTLDVALNGTIVVPPVMVLGHEFRPMTKQDWYGYGGAYGGAEPGTLICHLDDRDLLWHPELKVLSEMLPSESPFANQREWTYTEL